MIALSLPEIKDFMNKLLCTDTFGHFLLKESPVSPIFIHQMKPMRSD